MGLNAYRDEAGAFVAALGASAAEEETVLRWLDEEMAELKASRDDSARLRHQIYDVLFLLFSLAADRGLDLDAEWEGAGDGGSPRTLGREDRSIDPAGQYDQIAELYDGYPGYYTEDIDFFVEETAAAGGPVLEIGAGTGRLSFCLAAAGVDVVAVDSAPAMLRVLRRKQAGYPRLAGKVEPVVADMRRLSLGRTFPLAIVPFRTFLYLLTEEDQRAALGAIREHLSPGGKVILAFFVPPKRLVAQGRTPEEVAAQFPAPDGSGGVIARDWTEFDRARRRVISHITYQWKRSGARVQHELVARYVFPEEMPPLLESCGYRVVAAYGGFDRRPLAEDSREQIWVAERREG